jgi:hypothetical protein
MLHFLAAPESKDQWYEDDKRFNVTTASKAERDAYIRHKNWLHNSQDSCEYYLDALDRWEIYADEDFKGWTVEHF